MLAPTNQERIIHDPDNADAISIVTMNDGWTDADSSVIFNGNRNDHRDCDTMTSVSSIRDVDSIMSTSDEKSSISGTIKNMMKSDLNQLMEIDRKLARLQSTLIQSRPRSAASTVESVTASSKSIFFLGEMFDE